MNTLVDVSLLEAFGEAWNAHDLDALMRLMSDDCIYYAAAGPEAEGREYVGPAAVRDAYAGIFEKFPDARWDFSGHFVSSDTGVSTWRFFGTATDGAVTEVMGCDVFEISGNQIRIKNSFRKNRT